MSCWQFGNWSVSIPSCIPVNWQVCWRWHIFWQCLVNDCAWVKSPAMFAHCQNDIYHLIFDKFVTHPSLNLIGLWSSCKTKTYCANLSVCVWTSLAIECFSSLLSLCSAKFEKHDSHIFGCSDVTQSFWLKSSLNMRFGLLWCGVSSDAILACYLPLLFSVTHSCKDWHGSCQSWDSAFYSWWLQIKDMGKVNSGCTMTSMYQLLPAFTPARDTVFKNLESRL